MQYLLLPRSTGLFALVKRLREDDAAKDYESYICDCTMQYSTYSGDVPDSSGENRQHDVGVPEIKSFLCPVGETRGDDGSRECMSATSTTRRLRLWRLFRKV